MVWWLIKEWKCQSQCSVDFDALLLSTNAPADIWAFFPLKAYLNYTFNYIIIHTQSHSWKIKFKYSERQGLVQYKQDDGIMNEWWNVHSPDNLPKIYFNDQ